CSTASRTAAATSSGVIWARSFGRGWPSIIAVSTWAGWMSEKRSPLPRYSHAQRLGQADDRVLGRGVDGAARQGDAADARRDVDDVAAASWQHPLDRQARAVDDAEQVHVDLAASDLIGLLVERPDPVDAGVVDDDVERAIGVLGCVEEGGERVAVGDVERGRGGVRPIASAAAVAAA